MKTIATTLLALLLTTYAWSQDPKFRDAEPRRSTASPAASPSTAGAPTSDDTSASVGRISSMQMLDDTNTLRVGDTLSLRIVEDKDRTLSLRIQASGDIQAPHLGLVRAAGQTCKKIAFSMKRELEKQYFQQATVIVALEFRPLPPGQGPGQVAAQDMEYFTVFGQVQRQGKYELSPEEELTISQALLRAGGPTGFGKTKKVHVVRKTPKGNITINVNCDDIMKRGRLEKDIPIRPNDVIIVDEKVFNF